MSDDHKINVKDAELTELRWLSKYWNERADEVYRELVQMVGDCHLCQNAHYPLCEENEVE